MLTIMSLMWMQARQTRVNNSEGTHNEVKQAWTEVREARTKVKRARTESEQDRARTSMIDGVQVLRPVHSAQWEEEEGREGEEKEGEERSSEEWVGHNNSKITVSPPPRLMYCNTWHHAGHQRRARWRWHCHCHYYGKPHYTECQCNADCRRQ